MLNIGQNDYNFMTTTLEDEMAVKMKKFITDIRKAYGNLSIFVLCSTMWAGDRHCPFVRDLVAEINQVRTVFVDMRLPGVELEGCKAHPGV